MPFTSIEQKREWARRYKLRYPEKHKAWVDFHRSKARAKAKEKSIKAWIEKDKARAISQVAGAIAEVKKRIMARDRIKVCSKCKNVKSLDVFRLIHNKTDMWQIWCNECHAIAAVNWQKRNPDKTKQYGKTGRDRMNADPVRLIKTRIRQRINKAIKLFGRGVYVQGGKLRYLGCTAQEAVKYIERQMNSRMTWANYGKSWQIDHVQPCAAYDLSKEEDRRKAFHYTNLQPLWARANIRKGDKPMTKPHQPELILA
jgi:hypothetical protein